MIAEFKYPVNETIPNLFRSIQVGVGASIDFIVFGNAQLKFSHDLIPHHISGDGYQSTYKCSNEKPTIRYNDEAKCENNRALERKSLAVELSDEIA